MVGVCKRYDSKGDTGEWRVTLEQGLRGGSNELQNFGVERRDPLPRFFVSVDSGGVEVAWNQQLWNKIIPLTKVMVLYSILLMEHSYFGLLDLGAELIALRKSLLMEATSFRVGTFFNSLFLASFSIGGSL